MTSIPRLPLAAVFATFVLVVPLHGGNSCPPTFTIVWPGGEESPGIPVERPGWYISVIPQPVELEGLETAVLQDESHRSDARILFADASQRLCLLEADTTFPEARVFPLADTVKLKAGQKLECLSNRSACLTALAGKDWSYKGEQLPTPLLRVRVSDPEQFCATGTPLVRSDGHLVGILSGHETDASGVAFAIPASRIHKLIEEVKRFNTSGPVWVGLIFDNLSSTPEVLEVKTGSPAESAGIESGDVILSVNGREIESLQDLVEIILDLPAGEEVDLRVLRQFSETELRITPSFAATQTPTRP